MIAVIIITIRIAVIMAVMIEIIITIIMIVIISGPVRPTAAAWAARRLRRLARPTRINSD